MSLSYYIVVLLKLNLKSKNEQNKNNDKIRHTTQKIKFLPPKIFAVDITILRSVKGCS